MVGGDTSSSLALLGAEQNNWLWHLVSLFMAVSMRLNMQHSYVLHAALLGEVIWDDRVELCRTWFPCHLYTHGYCHLSYSAFSRSNEYWTGVSQTDVCFAICYLLTHLLACGNTGLPAATPKVGEVSQLRHVLVSHRCRCDNYKRRSAAFLSPLHGQWLWLPAYIPFSWAWRYVLVSVPG